MDLKKINYDKLIAEINKSKFDIIDMFDDVFSDLFEYDLTSSEIKDLLNDYFNCYGWRAEFIDKMLILKKESENLTKRLLDGIDLDSLDDNLEDIETFEAIMRYEFDKYENNLKNYLETIKTNFSDYYKLGLYYNYQSKKVSYFFSIGDSNGVLINELLKFNYEAFIKENIKRFIEEVKEFDEFENIESEENLAELIVDSYILLELEDYKYNKYLLDYLYVNDEFLEFNKQLDEFLIEDSIKDSSFIIL